MATVLSKRPNNKKPPTIPTARGLSSWCWQLFLSHTEGWAPRFPPCTIQLWKIPTLFHRFSDASRAYLLKNTFSLFLSHFNLYIWHHLSYASSMKFKLLKVLNIRLIFLVPYHHPNLGWCLSQVKSPINNCGWTFILKEEPAYFKHPIQLVLAYHVCWPHVPLFLHLGPWKRMFTAYSRVTLLLSAVPINEAHRDSICMVLWP